ncbi:uncharacterized protein LOC122506117 [Leptopilina heterotoma]|uniref:uncharacterized protein LOC122506117 n=1 Tax=Leptopilina heterotoma TaxID=63436 RepID=UPI001CA91F1D|nr:uncharacterized protein LOC122506117 [Leptopilina heterotoma]
MKEYIKKLWSKIISKMINVTGLKIDKNNELIRNNGRILCTIVNEEDGSVGEAFIEEGYLQNILPNEGTEGNEGRDFENTSSAPTIEIPDDDEDISEAEEKHFQATASEDIQLEKKWPPDNVKLLITSYEEIWQNPANKKKMPNTMWEMVVKKLNQVGCCKYNKKDCMDKFKSLKRTYKNQKKRKETSGEGNADWEHYEQMHNLMFQKPEMNPIATSSNITGFKKSKPIETKKRKMTIDSSSDEEKQNIKQPRKKKNNSEMEKILDFMEKKEENRNKFIERFLSILEKK